MKPWTQQSWYRSNLRRAGRFCFGLAGVFFFATLDLALVGPLLLVCIVLDWISLRLRRELRAGAFDLKLEVRPQTENAEIVVGSTVVLHLEITAMRQISEVLISPLIPTGVEPVDADCWVTSFVPQETQTARIRYVLNQPGQVIFSGIMLHTRSPMGLFTQALFLRREVQIPVLPDLSDSPNTTVWRFLRRTRRERSMRSQVMRRMGSEFRELREYVYPEPVTAVDWKATARLGRLIVREFEAPREFSIRVLLDASVDLTHRPAREATFTNAASLVAKLGLVASVERIPLYFTAFDQHVIAETKVRGSTDLHNITTELVALPELSLTAHALAVASHEKLFNLADGFFKTTLRQWRGSDRAPTLAETIGTNGGDRPSAAQLISFLVEFKPDLLYSLRTRCPICKSPVFADESCCMVCSSEDDRRQPSPRTSCLIEILFRALNDSRGREMLVLISALRGGETCDEVADLLALAAAGHRRVHVVLPTIGDLEDQRHEFESQSNAADLSHIALANVDKLSEAQAFEHFRGRLQESDVKVHRLESREDLDAVVAELLLSHF
ncbi:DUF58 domain-containing protein [Candidatus Eisenbacteria bacterium]|uniref:DUF58 domain-containing protein n=1 Tax=Eiseniibacteriota bacterium TaxID=2212470 RepID=A0ABV6YIP4_UNCEI